MEEIQGWVKLIVSIFLTAVITTLITTYIVGIFSRNKKINDSATKDDLIEVEKKAKNYTDASISNHEKVHDGLHDVIDNIRKDNCRVETKVEKVGEKIDTLMILMLEMKG